MNLLDMYEGAVENAESNGIKLIDAAYFSEYADGALDVALDDGHIEMLVEYHSDKEGLRDYEKRANLIDIEL